MAMGKGRWNQIDIFKKYLKVIFCWALSVYLTRNNKNYICKTSTLIKEKLTNGN